MSDKKNNPASGVKLGAVPDYDPTQPLHRAAMAELLEMLADPTNPNPEALARGARNNWHSAVIAFGLPRLLLEGGPA